MLMIPDAPDQTVQKQLPWTFRLRPDEAIVFRKTMANSETSQISGNPGNLVVGYRFQCPVHAGADSIPTEKL